MSENELEAAKQQAEKAGLEKLQILLNFLINREQDLRFTSNPRLILETTMIKLCQLNDYLSFGDLLDRIGTLEKKLLDAASASRQIKSDQVSDPAAPWVSETREEQTRQEEVDKNHCKNGLKIKEWDSFLDFLESKSRPMFNVLKDWEFLNLTEETLEIAKGNQSFSASFFDDNDRYAQLSSFCRDFFKRDIRIKILANNNIASEKKANAMAGPSEADAEKTEDLPQPVQDILKMFHGEIKKGKLQEK
jgi:DNA polymerase-3 subunit gamma/tau